MITCRTQKLPKSEIKNNKQKNEVIFSILNGKFSKKLRNIAIFLYKV
jgi:hypothetical protein